jgi:hypothetical protein
MSANVTVRVEYFALMAQRLVEAAFHSVASATTASKDYSYHCISTKDYFVAMDESDPEH